MRIKSNYSDNWYDSFRVIPKYRTIKFYQRDARRGGQVARIFTVTFDKNGNPVGIRAESANGGRVEHYQRTQCLSLCVEIYNKALKAEKGEKVEKSEKSVKADENGFIVALSLVLGYSVIGLALFELVPAWYVLVAGIVLWLVVVVFYRKPFMAFIHNALGGE